MQEKIHYIKKGVEFCKENVPYYKNSLKDVTIKSLQDFKKIPIIYKKDYVNNTPPANSKMLSRKAGGCFLFSTGGTTSNPKYVLRDFKDIEDQYMEYSGLDVSSDDTVLNLFMPGIWGIFTTANLTLMKFGCKIIPYGGTDLNLENFSVILKLMEEFKVNFLVGVPSTIVSVVSHLKNKDRADILDRIDKIFCLGEMVTASTIEYLKINTKNAKIKSKYGLMESAGIGYQCGHLGGNNYHVFPDRYVEIIDDNLDTNRGSIVVTTLNERLVPLLRYNTGDAGILHEKNCECGQKTILRVLGRNDDEIVFASVHMSTDLISRIIDEVAGECNQIFQIILDKKDNLDCVKINIESKKILKQGHKKRIANEIIKLLYREIPDVVDAINSKKIKSISVNVVNPNSIKRIGTSGKVKKVMDLRK